MATRNLTVKFESLRSQLRGGKRRRNGGGDDGTLLSGSRSDDADLETGTTLPNSLPPEWVDIVDTIKKDIATVKDSLRTLAKLHSSRLKVSFASDDVIADQEKDIEILTQEVTRLLRKSEKNVKQIAAIGNTGRLSAQERSVRLNVMRSLATELNAQSKQFRTAQKDFLKQLKDQEQQGNAHGFDDEKGDKAVLNDEDALDRGLNPEQTQALEEMNSRASEREKEIIRIAQSINELASLFRELNVLVIEQGTILDRIDYHIEQTANQVQRGTKELEKADEYSKKMYSTKCIACLIIAIIILVLIIIIAKSSSS